MCESFGHTLCDKVRYYIVKLPSGDLRERDNLNVSSRERYTRAIDGLYEKRLGDSVILETRVKHFDHVIVAYADVQFELLHVARVDYEIFHTKASIKIKHTHPCGTDTIIYSH
jgi:hypothetical protein